MFPSVERLLQIVAHDLDPEFIESVAIGAAWGYSTLYDDIAAETGLPEALRAEQFSRRRGYVMANAMKRAASQHGVPFDFLRLECNGQMKLLLKAGRVILIQEPFLTLEDHPRAADYKVKLAGVHGLISQGELDLGDRRRRVQDWSGCVLGVLLHGTEGREFTQQDRMLGSLMFGLTDASYDQWVLRVDLHQIAMYGRSAAPPLQSIMSPEADEPSQPDNVRVTLKRKNIEKGRV